MSSSFRKLIFLLCLAGIVYAAFQFMIKPANKSLDMQKKRVEDKRSKLIVLEEAHKRIDSLDQQVKKLQDAVNFFENKLPNQNEIYEVLRQVSLMANKHGLQTKDVETLKSSYKNGYIQQPIKLELNGDFLSYYKFITKLEKMERITKITDLSIKSKDNFGSTDTSMVVNVFYQDKAS